MLCRKCDTRDPFTIAAKLGIRVLHEPLGSIRGYYSRTHRIKFIHINQDLSKERQRQVCAHELGHAILHPKSNHALFCKQAGNRSEPFYGAAVASSN